MVSSPSNTAFSVCSFIGVVLMSISLPWHLHYCKSLSCSIPYPFIRGSTIHSMEYRNMRVHALDRFWMSHPLHQLLGLERQCNQLGTYMVRYRYISTFCVFDCYNGHRYSVSFSYWWKHWYSYIVSLHHPPALLYHKTTTSVPRQQRGELLFTRRESS